MRDELANDYLVQQDEITRLKGEVERAVNEIKRLVNMNDRILENERRLIEKLATAEARVQELEAQLDPEALTASYMAGQASRNETVRTLQDFVDELVAERTNLRAQLAELRARVRPGVEDIMRVIDATTALFTRECKKAAQAIHAMLPPAPKVLSVDEMMRLGVETLDSWKGNVIDLRLTCEAIHKAMGGEE